MTETHPNPELKVTFQSSGGPDDSTRAELKVEDRVASGLWIIPFTLRIGAATVRMDGIGGVGTEEDCRNKGYSRAVLEATVEWMKQRDAAISMLYGIPNFYPKFGYATAGPNHYLRLDPLPADTPAPTGWAVRPLKEADLPAIQRLYTENTRNAVGAAARSPESHIWNRLLATLKDDHKDECRVVEDSEGRIRGYVWRGKGFWPINQWEGYEPDALILSEAAADSPAAADAVLTECRKWGSEETATNNGPAKTVILSLPPENPVAVAAMRQEATHLRRFSVSGESMVRTLNVRRLLESLQPELKARLRAARYPFTGSLSVNTDLGSVTLAIQPEGITVQEEPAGPENALAVTLPQFELARLALGAFPPHDLFSRLETPPDERTQELLEVLFPQRSPHMYIADRF